MRDPSESTPPLGGLEWMVVLAAAITLVSVCS